MKILNKFYILIFLLILSVPLIQMKFGLLTQEELYGSEIKTNLPTITIKNWHEGEWQSQFSDWFAQNFNLKSLLVKIDNQINYELFQEISAKSNSPVILGRNNYLFEKGYIDSLNNRDVVPLTELVEQVEQYMLLTEELLKRNITLLLLIAPTKASHHRDLIPDKYLLQEKYRQPTNYERIVPLLKERNAIYIDGHELFKDWQKESEHTLFATGGTHWGYVGLCKLNQELIRVLTQMTKKNILNINCEPTVIEEELYSANRDLLNLANLLDESDFITPTPYPRITSIKRGDEWQPKILFVGDSFLWTLTAMLRDQNVYDVEQMYYYFNTAVTYPGEISEEIDRYNWDWENRVLNQDIIIIEASETAVNNIGFGFMDLLLEYLERVNDEL